MLLMIHELKDRKGKIILKKKEFVDSTLYSEMKSKKEKLVQQIKTEKVINPKCQEKADELIADIKKKKCGYGKVGRIEYYYESLKGMYFYLHKIVESDSTFIDSTRFYCVMPSETMYTESQKTDPIINQ